MQLLFTKMHGLGNDFVVVDGGGAEVPDAGTLHAFAKRRTGIGFDQLLWLEPPRSPNADVYYRVFNADGSEVEQCGNGARCIAKFIAGHVANQGQSEFRLEHQSGISRAIIQDDNQVSVELGVPEFSPEAIPFVVDARADYYPIIVAHETLSIGVVSVGNPHAVVEVDSVDAAQVSRLGPLLESHERFPNRANIGFMQVVDANHVCLRVYERGVGETRACGTGACAAMIVGRIAGKLGDSVAVQLPGGTVTVRWEGLGSAVWLTGEAITVFEGTVDV